MHGIEHRGETGCGREWNVFDPLGRIERSAINKQDTEKPRQQILKAESQAVIRPSSTDALYIKVLRNMITRFRRWL